MAAGGGPYVSYLPLFSPRRWWPCACGQACSGWGGSCTVGLTPSHPPTPLETTTTPSPGRGGQTSTQPASLRGTVYASCECDVYMDQTCWTCCMDMLGMHTYVLIVHYTPDTVPHGHQTLPCGHQTLYHVVTRHCYHTWTPDTTTWTPDTVTTRGHQTLLPRVDTRHITTRGHQTLLPRGHQTLYHAWTALLLYDCNFLLK